MLWGGQAWQREHEGAVQTHQSGGREPSAGGQLTFLFIYSTTPVCRAATVDFPPLVSPFGNSFINTSRGTDAQWF